MSDSCVHAYTIDSARMVETILAEHLEKLMNRLKVNDAILGLVSNETSEINRSQNDKFLSSFHNNGIC